MKTLVWFASCLAPFALFACASTSSSSASSARGATQAPPSSSGGSLWDRLDAARAARAAKGPDATLDANAGAADIPADQRARFETWWKHYLEADARWPASKAAWLKTAAPGPNLLAENLLRRHVLAYDAGVRGEYERAGRELVDMSAVAAPLIVAGLRGAAGDTLVRQHATTLIGAMGPSTIPAIEAAMNGADDQGRWELVRALARMKSPATTPLLSKIAREKGAFEPRIEAIKGLSENGDTAGFGAVAACLEDGDPSVRKFAMRYLAGYGRKDGAALLVACMERCDRERDREGVDEAHLALKKSTQLDAPKEPAAWRAVLRRAGYELPEGR